MAEHSASTANFPANSATRIEVYGWTANGIESRQCATLAEATGLLPRFRCAWIDMEGIQPADCAMHLEDTIGLTPLGSDTLIEGVRRPGADDFGQITIVTMRSHSASNGVEFIDFLIAPNLLVTIQEKTGGDSFGAVRERLRSPTPHLMRADENMIFLLLARAICEGFGPLLREYNDNLEKFEHALVRHPDSSMLDRIHDHRRQLLFLRQGLAPLYQALSSLHGPSVRSDSTSQDVYARLAALRELQDETGALLDVVEFQKDSAQHLLDIYLNAASNRLNEIVRVLTIISVIFMPLTLIAGIYGMNFHGDPPYSMPELEWKYGYPYALLLMLVCVIFLMGFFRHKGWLGDPLKRQKDSATTPRRANDGLRSPTALILSRRRGKNNRLPL